MIELYPVQVLNNKGKRDYNQDNVYPAPDRRGEPSRFYMVCDGVGGSARGDIASQLLCECFSNYFAHQNSFSENHLSSALSTSMEAMDDYIRATGEGESMASTLTFIGIQDKKVVFAHIGDSRIYHIREGSILYRTKDHSLMNEWIEKGIITAEEAVVHPRKNHVTRAVVAGAKQVKIELEISDDIKAGDYFFLCSDGILEAIDENELVSILRNSKRLDDAIEQVDARCQLYSKDNYSAYLLRVKHVTSFDDPIVTPREINRFKKYMLPAAVGALALVGLGIILSNDAESGKQLPTDQAESIETELEQLRNLDTLSLEAPAPPTKETNEE